MVPTLYLLVLAVISPVLVSKEKFSSELHTKEYFNNYLLVFNWYLDKGGIRMLDYTTPTKVFS